MAIKPDKTTQDASLSPEGSTVRGGQENRNLRQKNALQVVDNNPWSDQEERLREMPKHLHKLFKRAWSGKSRRAAILANCVMCMGYERAEVRRCTATACPLWPYRCWKTPEGMQRKARKRKGLAENE